MFAQPLAIYVAFVASLSAFGVTTAGVVYIVLHHVCFSLMPLALIFLGGALIFDTEEAIASLGIVAPSNLPLAVGCLSTMVAVGALVTARGGCLMTQGIYASVLSLSMFAFYQEAEGLTSQDKLALGIFGGAAATLAAAKFFSPVLIERYGVGSAGKPKIIYNKKA